MRCLGDAVSFLARAIIGSGTTPPGSGSSRIRIRMIIHDSPKAPIRSTVIAALGATRDSLSYAKVVSVIDRPLPGESGLQYGKPLLS